MVSYPSSMWHCKFPHVIRFLMIETLNIHFWSGLERLAFSGPLVLGGPKCFIYANNVTTFYNLERSGLLVVC
jgi:hypothetical protein